MAGIKQAFSSTKVQTIIFFLLVFIVYFFIIRPREIIRDFEILNDRAYLALGSMGIQIIDISNSTNPTLIKTYDTPGSANQISLNDNKLYLADGENGLLIYSIEDPNNLVLLGRIDTPGNAEDVSISGNKAYLADGKSGIQTIEINNPDKPNISNTFNPGGYAYRIHSDQKNVFLADRQKHLGIYDFSDPQSPTQNSVIETSGDVLGITFENNLIYLATDEAGLAIFDINDKTKPLPLGSYDTPGNATTIVISGQYAYIADGSSGIQILEINDPSKPTKVGQSGLVDNGVDISVRDNQIYVADGSEGLRILDPQLQISYQQLSPINQPGNVVDVAVNQHYAFLASESQGVRVLDIANPQEPKEVGLFDTPERAIGITTAGDFIYVADGKGDLRILYISNFNTDSVELTEISNLELEGESTDVYIEGNFAYVAAGNAGLRIANLEDPANPTEIGSEENAGNALGVVVSGDYAYVASGENGLKIVNISDRTKPAVIASSPTGGAANAVGLMKANVGGERTYALIAAGNNGLRVIDVTDPYQPKEVGFNPKPTQAYDVIIPDPLGKYAYVSDTTQGLWVMDLSDPTHPKEIELLETPGEAHGLDYQDARVFIADFERGMRITDVANPFDLPTIGFYDVPRQVGDVVVQGNAYLIDSGRGLRVVDVKDPRDPREIGFFDTPGRSQGLAIQGNYAYMGSENNLKILDISKPSNPQWLKDFGIPQAVTAVAIAGENAYVANGEGGLRVVQISDPASPGSAGSYETPGSATDVYIAGIYAYIADGRGGVSIVNVSDPNRPQTTSLLNQIRDGQGVVVDGNHAYIAGGEDGLYVVNVSKPAAPEQLAPLPLDPPGIALDLAIVDDFLFLAAGSGGIQAHYILQEDQPLPVGNFEPTGESVALDVIPIKVNEDEPRHFYVYIASDELGMQIIDANQSMSPVQIGLFNIPGIYPPGRTLLAAPAAIASWLSIRGQGIADKISTSVRTYLFDLLVFVVTLMFWISLVAQFVLPVEVAQDRLEAPRRLFSYMTGGQSAAIYVKEGKIFQGLEKSKPEATEAAQGAAPGVLLVDASSAAILQKNPKSYSLLMQFLLKPIFRMTDRIDGDNGQAEVNNIRIEGPGLIFTQKRGFPANPKYEERLLSTADLRPQVRTRPEVRGYTRDGIEVKTNVITLFSIGDPPAVLPVGYDGEEQAANVKVIAFDERVQTNPIGTGSKTRVKFIKEFSDELDYEDKEEIHRYIQAHKGTKIISSPYKPRLDIRSGPVYSVDQQRIFAAIYSKARDTQEQKYLDWTELPPHTAVEIFRSMLAQEVYDALYQPKKPDEYQITEMRATFSKRVRNLGILAYQYVRHKNGLSLEQGQVWDEDLLSFYPVQELHQPKVLRTRGIKILSAAFSSLEPTSEKVKERMVDYWSASWERDATITSASLELEAMRIRNLARAQAQSEMVLALAQILQMEAASQEAMAVRVFQALETAAADSKTQQLLPNETIAMLRTLRDWLLPGPDEPAIDVPPPPPPNVDETPGPEGN